MSNKLIVILLCVLAASFSGCSSFRGEEEQVNHASDSDRDIRFAIKTVDGGMLNLMLGKLAKDRSKSAEVRSYADMIVDAHRPVYEELKELATDKKIPVSDSLSKDSRAIYQELSKISGVEFDKEYINTMVETHKLYIQDFSQEVNNGVDHQIKLWADTKLSVLEAHLQKAKEIRDNLQ